ncbi:DOPA 4,5-dioxygenase family protein [Mesorhizobium montanum]|uniref:DOPA 4,5-dioxygenase family protein n=1 Tax=Mesorhizobium montanum TaxID=3072323 RepID=UPI003D3132A5
MYQVSFATEFFRHPRSMADAEPRRPEHILIHPNTTNPKREHLVDPIWIGRALAVNGEVLGERMRRKRRWR